ncbi:unnamed protein product [Anisakis simplex]|uniref:FYVE domain-containing protein n=1 Tax=Anisakis simplex TaxID=6269 RepID=A0A0M3JL47_ANISI|nr:unnamed protein product [Anisakis simplex]
MVELREELLPLSDAQWEKDADVDSCKGCQLQFTVSRRKHHCRSVVSCFRLVEVPFCKASELPGGICYHFSRAFRSVID